jgi:hypothetical protein
VHEQHSLILFIAKNIDNAAKFQPGDRASLLCDYLMQSLLAYVKVNVGVKHRMELAKTLTVFRHSVSYLSE